MEATSNKRRKAAPPPIDDANSVVAGSLIDLHEPHLLSHVASFLPKPSRSLLAVALTAPSASPKWGNGELEQKLSAGSRAVLSLDNWVALDFTTIDESIRENLSDDDLRAVLACIDARNELRKLAMYCGETFSGRGLNALRGSLVLEHIRLLGVDMKLEVSKDIVLSFLDSIVEAEGNSLKLIQLPAKIAYNADTFEFLQHRYSPLLTSRRKVCAACRGPFINQNEEMFTRDCFGIVRYDFAHGAESTCHGCLKEFCCGEKGVCRTFRCRGCKRQLCPGCAEMCEACENCSDCRGSPAKWKMCEAGCERRCCIECAKTCRECHLSSCIYCTKFETCSNCGKTHCTECFDDEDCDVICEGECDGPRCKSCLVMTSRTTNIDCKPCLQRAVNLIHLRCEMLEDEIMSLTLR
ncbi:hypothetical protein ACHAWF_014398 [Thalassiosira exigua]